MENLYESTITCDSCQEHINNEKHALQCDFCLGNFHSKCCNASPELSEMRSDKNFNRNLKWLCDDCVRLFAPITQITMFISRMADRISTLEVNTSNLKREFLLELKTTTQAITSALTLPEKNLGTGVKTSYPHRHSKLSRRCELNTWGFNGSLDTSFPFPAEGEKPHKVRKSHALNQVLDTISDVTTVCSDSLQNPIPMDIADKEASDSQIAPCNSTVNDLSLSMPATTKGPVNSTITALPPSPPSKLDSPPVCVHQLLETPKALEYASLDHTRTAMLGTDVSHPQESTATPMTTGATEETGFSTADTASNMETLVAESSPGQGHQQPTESSASTAQLKTRGNTQSLSTTNKPIPFIKNKGIKEVNQDLIIGTNDSTELQAAPPTWSGARKIFVSRLAPTIDNKTLSNFLIQKGINVRCRQLRTRFPNYSSFCLDVQPSEVDLVLSPALWPKGVLIMPFLGRRGKNRVKGLPAKLDRPTSLNNEQINATKILQTEVLTQTDPLTSAS